MSRYTVTETRRVTFDAQWDPAPGEDAEELAVEEAHALPVGEWDTLEREVKAL